MQGALDACPVVVTELPHAVGHVVEVGGGHRLVAQEHLPARHARLRLPAEVEHDLQELVGIDTLVDRLVKVRRQRLGEELDLGIPASRLPIQGFLHQPKEGTRPFAFSFTGARRASSRIISDCVTRVLKPRARRASIMWES